MDSTKEDWVKACGTSLEEIEEGLAKYIVPKRTVFNKMKDFYKKGPCVLGMHKYVFDTFKPPFYYCIRCFREKADKK